MLEAWPTWPEIMDAAALPGGVLALAVLTVLGIRDIIFLFRGPR